MAARWSSYPCTSRGHRQVARYQSFSEVLWPGGSLNWNLQAQSNGASPRNTPLSSWPQVLPSEACLLLAHNLYFSLHSQIALWTAPARAIGRSSKGTCCGVEDYCLVFLEAECWDEVMVGSCDKVVTLREERKVFCFALDQVRAFH